MATAAKSAPPSHITKTPEVCGGQPVIDDTRVRVVNIVALFKEGKTPEQMLLGYPSLNLAQIYAALSYYYDHPQEIEAKSLFGRSARNSSGPSIWLTIRTSSGRALSAL
jgi:uncharacterized protein (DUF433 family)